MIKAFQNLKKQLVQSLKDTHQQQQLLQKARAQFETEKIALFKQLITTLLVFEKQIALAKKLPNVDDRANKLLLEIYEKHHKDLEETLMNAGVTVLSDNPLDTFNALPSSSPVPPSNRLGFKRYLYQDVPLN